MAIDGSILVADDEQTDAFFLKMALAKAGVSREILVAHDGQEAVDYLARRNDSANRTVSQEPALIILDLKMPRMDGFDVLAWLSAREHFKDVPVVVLSSSSNQADIQKAKDLGAREYFVKPYSLGQLVSIAEEMRSHWLTPLPAGSSVLGN